MADGKSQTWTDDTTGMTFEIGKLDWEHPNGVYGYWHIPGYAENYARIAKYAKWMKGVGYVGIALDGLNSASKITEACTEGREGECEKTSFAEGGRFAGSTFGGAYGAAAAYGACNVAFGIESAGTSLLWCGIVAGGLGGYGGGKAGSSIMEAVGTKLYELKKWAYEEKNDYPSRPVGHRFPMHGFHFIFLFFYSFSNKIHEDPRLLFSFNRKKAGVTKRRITRNSLKIGRIWTGLYFESFFPRKI